MKEVPRMAATQIALQRLSQQRLSQNPLSTPAEIVTWMGAVQGQDYLGTTWAFGLRMQAATEDVVDRAFNEGTILRTHLMRPTWHFVTPEDIRWIVELTASRVNAISAYMFRQLELDDALFARSNAIIAKALEGGKQLTREELGSALAEGGIEAKGMRLGYIVFRAELDTVVCSGPRRGKQFTYALLDERAPTARRLTRDEALAELTLRYYTGHGPATVQDFAWWSGLTVADVKAGIAMVGSQLTHEMIDGQAYWFSAAMSPQAKPCESAFLLPTYDEYLIGYSSFDKSRGGGQDLGGKLVFDSTIVIGGQVMGSWRRTFKKGGVIIELAPFAPLTDDQWELVEEAAQRYGQFVGLKVTITRLNAPA
jgi:hypothetical protein